MVDSSRDLDPQPFREFLVLNAQILDRVLVLDLFEELCEPVALNDIAPESARLVRFSHLRSNETYRSM